MAQSYHRLCYAIAGLAFATICTTSPTMAGQNRTPASTDHFYDNVLIFNVVSNHEPFYEPMALLKDLYAGPPPSGHRTHIPMAVKERRSGAAVRATSVAGWRSGRVRRLAA